MDNLAPLVPLVLIMLTIASLVAIAARRVRIPYTVALVLVGLVPWVCSPVGSSRSAQGLRWAPAGGLETY